MAYIPRTVQTIPWRKTDEQEALRLLVLDVEDVEVAEIVGGVVMVLKLLGTLTMLLELDEEELDTDDDVNE